MARLGGDESGVSAIEELGHREATIRLRLYEDLKSISAGESSCEISLSLGVARFDPSNRMSIGELMVKADQAMYEQKRQRSRLFLEMETSIHSRQALWTLGNLRSSHPG